mmetsp:Transcript_55297/g.132014  ORF Transcript_55297/g.132014 Transcript_55297/m.132014 type:complete len:244 (+) Transcript_55297:77-808(+)
MRSCAARHLPKPLQALVSIDLGDGLALRVLQVLVLWLQLCHSDLHLLRQQGQSHRQHAGNAAGDQQDLGDSAGQADSQSRHGSTNHLHAHDWHHHWCDGQKARSREHGLEHAHLTSSLRHAQLVALFVHNGNALSIPLLHTREGDVGSARGDHGQIGNEGAHDRESRHRRHKLPPREGNGAGGGDCQGVGLQQCGPLNGGARAVHIVVDHVVGLIQPLSSKHFGRGVGHEHEGAQRHVHRNEG